MNSLRASELDHIAELMRAIKLAENNGIKVSGPIEVILQSGRTIGHIVCLKSITGSSTYWSFQPTPGD